MAWCYVLKAPAHQAISIHYPQSWWNITCNAKIAPVSFKNILFMMIKSTKWENEFDLKNNKENEFEKKKRKWIYIKKVPVVLVLMLCE